MSFLQHLTEVKSMTIAIKTKLMDNNISMNNMHTTMKIIDGLSNSQKEMFNDRFNIDLDSELMNMKKAMKFLSNCKLHTLK